MDWMEIEPDVEEFLENSPTVKQLHCGTILQELLHSPEAAPLWDCSPGSPPLTRSSSTVGLFSKNSSTSGSISIQSMASCLMSAKYANVPLACNSSQSASQRWQSVNISFMFSSCLI